MRIKICLKSENNIVLPFGYFSTIQGLIYSLLDKIKSEWLHQEGFKYEKRSFKLFVFSEIIERAKTDTKSRKFIFPDAISFYFSTPVDWIIEQFAKNLIFDEKIKLGENVVSLYSIETLKIPQLENNKIKIKALSPIEIHSTLKKEDGSSKTYYYSPFEREFSDLINKNLKKKWQAFYNKPCKYTISIFPVNSKSCRQIVTKEKGTVIKGWKGTFFIDGDKQLIKFAFDVGLGNRNSLGFGMIHI